MATPAPDPRRIAAEQRAEAARHARYVITVDDAHYTLRIGDLTATQVRALREQAGMAIPDLVRQMVDVQSTWDIFYTAAAIWLARLQASETVTFAAVADGLRLDQVLTMTYEDDAEPAEDFPDPQL